MENLTIESAKQFLKDNGYFVENLWSVHDVKSNYDCSDEEAQSVLNEVLNSDCIKQEINETIDIVASSYNLLRLNESRFNLSVEMIKREIKEDIETKLIPRTVSSFNELNDYVDANFYGGFTNESYDPSENYEFENRVQTVIDEWLKNGRP